MAEQDENGLLRRGDSLYSGHIGRSMNPTLCDRDLLEIQPYRGRPVRVGDVVILKSPEGTLVVHRVITADGEGIRTRGDNNTRDDPWRLREEDLLGRVAAACRGNRRRLIAGGWRGRSYALWIRGWRLVDRAVSWVLHPLYRGLARGGWARALCPPALRPRVVVFQEHGRSRLRLLMGRRVIGGYEERLRRWEIARPFRLLVDEAELPSPKGDLAGLWRSEGSHDPRGLM